MRRLRTKLAVTSIRLSVAYTLIFTIVAVAIVLFMTERTIGLLRDRIADSVDDEIVVLEETYFREGINGLMRQLELRAAAPGANLYVVADPAGQIIAGNVRNIESGVIDHFGWTGRPFTYTRFQDLPEREYRAFARIVLLPNGMRLLVGRDLGEAERFYNMVVRALALSVGVMLLLGILIWALIGRRALRRLDMVSQSVSRIMGGDRSERLPVSGAGDEFDRLAIRVNQLLDRINDLDKGLRHVADNIAHDLKTPLTRLRNKADAAIAAPGSSEQYRQVLSEMIDDADQIIRTFDALLMISRVESGSAAVRMQQLDLSAIAADVVELYQPVAEDRDVLLEIDFSPEMYVVGNRELLAQAVSNLLDNALKYGQPQTGQARIDVRISKEGDKLRLCVADNGPGIAPADRGRVVDRFTRLEVSRNLPGNGLGLSLVQAITRLHDGTLELADNAPGLRACLLLPEASESTPPFSMSRADGS